ncbi:hypothetical protein [Lentilactobacillus kefiri]|uniref:Uncharacterized protein n=3 Tax=Lentilactobacillus kefiri TaxID=33962 RepID=A0A8E1RK21_LENKE|nr:hypothetical protein FC95_GL001459 [Lentilactobacillus kefiri DSM 20587 = JCM 5818]
MTMFEHIVVTDFFVQNQFLNKHSWSRIEMVKNYSYLKGQLLMEKITKYALTFVSAFSIMAVSQTQSKAASWHYGTPKILRGTYNRTMHAGSGKYRFKFKQGVQMTRRTYTAFGLGDPFSMNRVSYKRYGRYTYLLRGVEYVYSHKWNYVKLRATHYKLKERIITPHYAEKHFSKVYYR